MASFSTSFDGSENPLSESSAFATVSGWGNVKKVSGVALATTAATHSLAQYVGQTFGDNQYAKAFNINDSYGGNDLISVATRTQSDGSGYYLAYRKGLNRVVLYKDTGPASLSELNEWVITPASNASIMLVSRGFRHSIYYNDVLQAVYWEDTYHDGKPAIHFYADGAITDESVGDFECGDEPITDTVYTTFAGTENPLSESSRWAPVLNETGITGPRWYGGLQKGSGKAYGLSSTAGANYCSFLRGSFNDDQYAAIACDAQVWAGVATRVQDNRGECYLAVYWQVADSSDSGDPTTANRIRLYRYDRTNTDATEGYFHVLARATPVQTIGSTIILELMSVGNRHQVFIRSGASAIEATRELVIDYDASSDSRKYHGGTPGCAALGNTTNIYDFWCDAPRHYGYVGSGGFLFGGAATTHGPKPPYSVLDVVPAWPLTHTIAFDGYIADFGDGFEQRVNFSAARSRANGVGGVSSYKGRNQFTLQFKTMDYAGAAADLWSFYQARHAGLDAFYIYNLPDEAAGIDSTGFATTGRYLVRFKDQNLSREKFMLKLYNSRLDLIEVTS
jgi:hypothetical protein